MSSITHELARFAVEAEYDDLPVPVVHEAKRIIMDSIGCAIAGLLNDKGIISVKLARKLGGPPESSIIGTEDKVSCSAAAFANGELINALDFDSVLSPPIHVSPYVIPAPLALAEISRASGRDLILAIVLGHEIAARIGRALVTGRRLSILGCSQCVLGGVLGAGKMLKLAHKEMCYALGLAGHFCPVPTFEKWVETAPSAMTKFGSPGWVSSAEVNAALLAEMGYVGDITVLDGDYGFWKFFGADGWNPSTIMEKIGETWLILDTKYKPYPCCGILTTALDCFINIMEQNSLLPEEIEGVNVFCNSQVEKPIWVCREVPTQIDAQFSTPYVFAVTAYGIKASADWQDQKTMSDPKVADFMKKVNCFTHPSFVTTARNDRKSFLSMVEVTARGRMFKEERLYSKGTPFTEAETTDEELVAKFQENASRILATDQVNKAIDTLSRLEEIENIQELMRQITS